MSKHAKDKINCDAIHLQSNSVILQVTTRGMYELHGCTVLSCKHQTNIVKANKKKQVSGDSQI